MVKFKNFKSIFLLATLLTSIGISNSQTRVFDLNGQEGIIHQVNFLKYFNEENQDLLNDRFNKENI